MSRGSVIALYVFAAFVIFITQRGELPQYLGYLFGASSGSPGPGGASSVTSGTTTTGDASMNLSDYAKYAEIAAAFA